MESSIRKVRRVRRIVRTTDQKAPRRGQQEPEGGYVWRLTFRRPSWDNFPGPAVKVFDNRARLRAAIRRLRRHRSDLPPAEILKVERIRVVGSWEDVSA